MNILSVQGLSKTQGIKPLFSDVSFGIDDGERVGLIGANGGGKSTLLKIIAGTETADSGAVTFRQGVRVEYLPQDPPYDPAHSVLEHVFHSHTEVADAVAAYELACEAVEKDSGDEGAIRRLDEASRRMDALNAWEYETRAKAILSRLGVTNYTARMGELSGGYRRRVALARALLADWDLLILDEPTNHLDADTVAWLEDYLRRTPGAVLVVTHDRYFLDRVTRRILEIEGGTVRAFDGNFSYYLERRAEIEQAAVRADERRRTLLNRELEWLRRGARARRTKEKHRVERVHQMMAERPTARQNDLQFATGTRRLGSKIVELDAASKSLGGRLLLKDFTYNFAKGERLGIIGPNGAGKTTLVNLMTGRLAPDSGKVDIGSTVSFGYFSQEGPQLRPGERAIDFVKREGGEMLSTSEGEALTASQLLERFNFTGQMQYSDAGRLSGGERRRLQLVCTLLRDPNFLILDEPTNDLDIPTLQALEDFLEDFAGVLVVVSHDRYFLDRTVDHLLAFEGNGKVFEYPAPYETYTKLRDERVQQEAESGKKAAASGRGGNPAGASSAPAAVSADGGARPKKLSFNEQRELTKLEEEIPQLEERRAVIQTEMATAAADYMLLQNLTREQQEIDAQLEIAMERWAELAERAG